MQSCLPPSFDPWNLAASGGHLQGELSLWSMTRLKSLLNSDRGCVRIILDGGRDEQGVHYCVGQFSAELEVVCQRCMQSMGLPLVTRVCLGLIRSDSQAKSLPKAYEPLLSSDGNVVLSEMVEDELILALPVAPMHSDLRQCEALGFVLPEARDGGVPSQDEPSPFAVLSELLNDTRQ
jgi:uncharacterized protein